MLLVLLSAPAGELCGAETRRISARNLLLSPHTPFSLEAAPGCFKWSAADVSLVQVVRLEEAAGCPHGSSRRVQLVTRALAPGGCEGGRGKGHCRTMVLAVPVEGDGSEARGSASCFGDESLGCEVNVGLISSLSISTTTREMVAQDDEMQWLQAHGYDVEGNEFSESAMRRLHFRWRWEGPSELSFVDLATTRQILDSDLEALASRPEAARLHYRVPVHATTPNPAVQTSATLLNETAAARQQVSGLVSIRIRPAHVMLWPGRRVAVPPGSCLRYHLCSHQEGVCHTPESFDRRAAQLLPRGSPAPSTRWSMIGNPAVGSVDGGGVFHSLLGTF